MKQNLPTEDESRSGSCSAGQELLTTSPYMWLAFMFFEERIDLERSILIGAGILGMAVLY